MITVDIKEKADFQIDIIDDEFNLVVNNEGEIITTAPHRYLTISSVSLTQLTPPLVSDGINLVLEAECLTPPIPYSYAHLEFILSYNKDFVADGALDVDILYKFESVNQDGWFLEYNYIYDFPGTGYPSYFSFIYMKVKYIALGLDINLSNPLYLFYRSRGCTVSGTNLYLSDSYGDYYGKIIDLKESYFSNTGTSKYNQIVVDLFPNPSDYGTNPWPTGKNIHYEVYVGSSPSYVSYLNGTAESVLHKDSSVSPSGFLYFDGSSYVGFGPDGIPSSMWQNNVVFITDEVDAQNDLFVVYRSKWDVGTGSWISRILKQKDFVSSPSRLFTPSSSLRIKPNSITQPYFLYVIIGTSPNVEDYFEDGDTTDYSKIIIGYEGLIDYASTINSSDRSHFYFYRNGSVINPGLFAFNKDENIDIVYISRNPYMSDEKVYVFWRAQYSAFPSSSSSSLSSSSLSSSSSSLSSSSLSSSSLSSSSSSLSGSSSSSSENLIDGYYLVRLDTGLSCEALILDIITCTHISDQTEWDSYQFDVCYLKAPSVYWKYTTDGIKHPDMTCS